MEGGGGDPVWVKGRVGEATARMGGAGEKVRPLWEWDEIVDGRGISRDGQGLLRRTRH